jgi:hypothetical protein
MILLLPLIGSRLALTECGSAENRQGLERSLLAASSGERAGVKRQIVAKDEDRSFLPESSVSSQMAVFVRSSGKSW